LRFGLSQRNLAEIWQTSAQTMLYESNNRGSGVSIKHVTHIAFYGGGKWVILTETLVDGVLEGGTDKLTPNLPVSEA
jgi:hypothetical protein